MTRSDVGNSAPSMPLRFSSAFLNATKDSACCFVSKKTALALPALAEVDHESQVWPVGVGVFANPDFALSHGHTVATLLPKKQVKPRYFAFFPVSISGNVLRHKRGRF